MAVEESLHALFTAALERVGRSGLSQPLQGSLADFAIRHPGLTVLIIPGAFYREYPQTGADGRRILDACKALSLRAEVLNVPSFSSTAESHAALKDRLDGSADEVIIVSLSKSSLDVAEFFIAGEANPYRTRMRGWISVSGLITGTPLIEWLEKARFRQALIRLIFYLRGYSFTELTELKHCPARAERLRAALPEAFPAYYIVGFPEAEDLTSRLARRSYRRVLPQGLSDGGGLLLRDVLELPGTLIPIKGQDHYLRDLDIAAVLKGILADIWSDNPCKTRASSREPPVR